MNGRFLGGFLLFFQSEDKWRIGASLSLSLSLLQCRLESCQSAPLNGGLEVDRPY